MGQRDDVMRRRQAAGRQSGTGTHRHQDVRRPRPPRSSGRTTRNLTKVTTLRTGTSRQTARPHDVIHRVSQRYAAILTAWGCPKRVLRNCSRRSAWADGVLSGFAPTGLPPRMIYVYPSDSGSARPGGGHLLSSPQARYPGPSEPRLWVTSGAPQRLVATHPVPCRRGIMQDATVLHGTPDMHATALEQWTPKGSPAQRGNRHACPGKDG